MAYLTKDIAGELGEKAALIDDNGATSWAQLDERLNRLVHLFRRLGVAPGGTVAVMSRNRRELVELCLAAMHNSIYMVMINWHWSSEEVAYVVADSGASVLFVDAASLATATANLATANLATANLATANLATATATATASVSDGPVQVVGIDGAAPGVAGLETLLAESESSEPDDQAIGAPMFYTSGTTGRPKGVRSTQLPVGQTLELLQLVVPGFQGQTGIPSSGVSLLCGPYYHSAQWAMATIPLALSSSLVILDGFDPAAVLRAIDEHKVTNMHLVPAQFVRLLALDPPTRDAFDGSSLVQVLHGAAPCRSQVKRDMLEWWGPCVSEYYGGTESGFLAFISGDEWLDHPNSVGRPTGTFEVEIRDDGGQAVPEGEVGQIWFRSLLGTDFEYHNAPEKTQEHHGAGGFATLGDVGYLDADGYLYLTDRKIDMIISGGVNIYPAEIEEVLSTHEAVLDVAVFGVPDAEMGENVKAGVVLRPGAETGAGAEAALIAFVQDRLARYKAPKSIDFHAELPRSEAGKLLKRELRAPYWADEETEI